jgi:protein-tyrosine phosphatase
MAEGLMREKIEKYKLIAEVDSAGFEPFHSGDAPDKRAIKVMKGHGIDISGQHSRLFRKSDFDLFDYIYVMDKGNYNDVESVASQQNHMQKVDYILNAVNPGGNQAVPDPYYGDDFDFEKAYQMLDTATEVIAVELKTGRRIDGE